MKIYHGSNTIVETPRLVEQNRFLDFGNGFYTTTNHDQAMSFAQKVVFRRGGTPIVNEYEIALSQVEASLKILRFHEAGEEWLDFVSANRTGTYAGEQFDLIIGAVANDDVYRTFQLYTAELLSKEQTVEKLRIKRLFDQYVFTTEKALGFLGFIKSETL